MRKLYLVALILVGGLFTVVHSAEKTELKRFTFTEVHMGTEFKIILYAPNEEIDKKASAAAFRRIAELDHIMSDYKKTSELMHLCQKAGGPPVKVSQDLFNVLSRSQALAKKSDGAFDVTVGPVVRLWRKSRRTLELPDPDRLKAAQSKVGYDKMRLDPVMRTVQLLLEGMLLDLGGIAKGYAAEAALAILRQFGITRALIVAGGDIACAGPPPNEKGWKVGIAPLKNPLGEPKNYLLLKNAAVSTSGDVEQFVTIKGKRYSHIVDPETGLGLVGRSSVSVIAPNATTTDSLATTVSVLGPEKGLELIEATKGAAALIIREEKGELVTIRSKRFSQYVHPSKK